MSTVGGGDPLIITSTVAIVAALIGGFLSAFGAWIAIGRQIKAQQDLLVDVAKAFFEFVVQEDIRRLENLQSYRSANSGAVSLFDINMLIANYQTFERNREHLIRVSLPLRNQINDVVSRIQTLAFVIQNAEQDRQSSYTNPVYHNPNHPEHNLWKQKNDAALDSIGKAFNLIPGLIGELKNIQSISST